MTDDAPTDAGVEIPPNEPTMSSYVLMKILESSPERYDRGIRMLGRGWIDSAYASIADLTARPGARVLDIGCGTGNVSVACARRGADVVGIDIDAGMLEVARQKPEPIMGSLRFVQIGATELDDEFEPGEFDSVVSCLALSEMSPDEGRYALKAAFRLLKPGGRLVVVDEVVPANRPRRMAHRLRRLPAVAATWILTQTTTRALDDLTGLVSSAGFEHVETINRFGGHLIMVTARRPSGDQEPAEATDA